MLIDWLIERAKRTPYDVLPGYMERFWLVPIREDLGASTGTGPVSWRRPIAKLLQRFNIAVRLNHILRSDLGRDPHDHPWGYLTIILRGGYTEYRYNERGMCVSGKWHGPGSILWRPANSWHMLSLPKGETAWTLFISGPYVQTWGFNTAKGKVAHRDYKGIN